MESNYDYTFYLIYSKSPHEYLYVGSTKHFSNRKSKHKSTGYLNDDNDIRIIYKYNCDKLTAWNIEQSWIDHFTPKWNKLRSISRKHNLKYFKIPLDDILRARGFDV